MLTIQELKKAAIEKLHTELEQARTESKKILIKVRTSQSKANHEVRKWKKYIAKILTVFNDVKTEKSTKTLEKQEK